MTETPELVPSKNESAQPKNGSALAKKVELLQQEVDAQTEDLRLLAWLHAEQGLSVLRLANALASLLAQQVRPQIEQQILAGLMGQ